MIYDDTTPIGELNVRWWLQEDRELRASDLGGVYRALEERDRGRQSAYLHYQRLYGNKPVEGVNPSSYDRVANQHRVTLNVVASVCDFATNRIGKHQPAPRPMTTAGNFTLQRKAKLLDRFLQAQFDISDVYETARAQFLDACVFGTGIIKVFNAGDDICVERVFPTEVIVDHHEAMYGKPRQMMHRKWVSRDVLYDMFITDDLGKREKARLQRVIRDAGRGLMSDQDSWRADDGVNDQVLVVEAWHLPSGDGADDGRHVIITDSGELFEEKWKHDYFPFLFLRWKHDLQGFWGVGLAEELNGIQIEINRMLMKIQTAYHLMARPLIFVDAASKVNKAHIHNEIGAFVPYVGNVPTVWTPQSFHPEFYAHLERLYEKAFEIAGMSQDSVSPKFYSEESGVARQTRHDVETERFSRVAADYEKMFMHLARQIVDRAKELGPNFAVPAPSDRYSIERIKWSDIDLSDDQYVLRCAPVSSLPALPSSRLDRVIMMVNAGLITDPQEARRLLDFEDLESEDDLQRAGTDDVDRILENIVDEGVYEPPEPYMDLNYALKRAQMVRSKAKVTGVPNERIDALSDWLDQVHMLQQRAAVEQQKLAAMQGAGLPPEAMPPSPGAPPAPGPDGAPPTAL